MPYLLCYTKTGEDRYRDINDSMHLALSRNGKDFTPLLNNTGVLFPEADMQEGTMAGTTKTLRHPWLFRFADGDAGVLAVRFNNASRPDPRSIDSIMVYRSKDFVKYRLLGFLKLGDSEIKNPRCRPDGTSGKYRIEWECALDSFCAWTEDFKSVSGVAPAASLIAGANSCDIAGAVPGNILEISQNEADYVGKMLSRIYNTDVTVPDLNLKPGSQISRETLPRAICHYSDGSTARRSVEWDWEAIKKIDLSRGGEYRIKGKIIQKIYPTPFIEYAGDPCVFHYNGKYYFTSSAQEVIIRASGTFEGLRQAAPITVHKEDNAAFWAQELHYIKDVPYIFTSLCREGKWFTVQSVVLRCKGDPEDPSAWETPRYVVKKDGAMLNKDKGVCLDMTYFCVDGVHYAAWSSRDLDPSSDGRNEYGTNGPADIYIAAIDPDTPWRLVSDPVCICRPIYGWDRIETEVVEGPFLLRHGDDLFMTFSGASVGVVYAVGLLRTKYGSDLLNPASWEQLPYPILTSESIHGQYGPGHNNFFKDPQNGEDDMISLLYRPNPEWTVGDPGMDQKNPRHAAVRRIHWNASGLPNLEMTPEEEVNPKLADVVLTVKIHG